MGFDSPDFVWTIQPIIDPWFELTDEEIDTNELGKFEHYLCKFEENMKSDPFSGFKLVQSAKSAGYDEDKHGPRFLAWLFHYLAVYLATHKGISEDDFMKQEKENHNYRYFFPTEVSRQYRETHK